MASNDKHDSEADQKTELAASPPPRRGGNYYFAVDIALRVLLFGASLTSVVVMVTTKERELVLVRPPGGVPIAVAAEAKFNISPAFIYLVAAMSVTTLYSILTAIASIGAILKSSLARSILLYFALLDALLLGIAAAATGASGGAGYIGWKGNSDAGWSKICNTFEKYCWYFGSSIALSAFASILLLVLTMLSVFSIHRRIHKYEVNRPIPI